MKTGRDASSIGYNANPINYRVHQLDWFDVESRIKTICGDMIKPLIDSTTDS